MLARRLLFFFGWTIAVVLAASALLLMNAGLIDSFDYPWPINDPAFNAALIIAVTIIVWIALPALSGIRAWSQTKAEAAE